MKPSLEILNRIFADGRYEEYAVIMGSRQPKLVPLWLDGGLIGLQSRLLLLVRAGL